MKTKELLCISIIATQQYLSCAVAASLPLGPGSNLIDEVYQLDGSFDSGNAWVSGEKLLSYFILPEESSVSIVGGKDVSFTLQGSSNGLRGIEGHPSGSTGTLTFKDFGGGLFFNNFAVEFSTMQGSAVSLKNYGSVISTTGEVRFENIANGINFSNNSITHSYESPMGGGAIASNGINFKSITGDVVFLKNSAISNTSPTAIIEASGGAIRTKQFVVNDLNGSLIFNENMAHSASNALGGAIYANSILIDNVSGNIEFHNNKAIAQYVTEGVVAYSASRGGAILVENESRLAITNTGGSISFLNNKAIAENKGTGYGGAIYLDGSKSQLIMAGNGNTVFAGNLVSQSNGTLKRQAIYHNGKPSDANNFVATHLAANEGYKIEFYDGNIFKGNLVINGHDGSKEVATNGEIIFSGGDYKDANGNVIVASDGSRVWTQVYQDITVKGGTMYIRDNAHVACNEYNITGGKLYVEGNSTLKVGLVNNEWTGTGNINVLGGEIYAGSATSFDKAKLNISSGVIDFQGQAVTNSVFYKGGILKNYQAYAGTTSALGNGLVLNATYTAGLIIDPNISVTMKDAINVPQNMFQNGIASESLFTLSTLTIGDGGTLMFNFDNLQELQEGKYWVLGVDSVPDSSIVIPWTEDQFALVNKNFGAGLDGYLSLEGNKVVLNIVSKPIPEPSSAVLGLIGFSSMLLRRRRRH